MGVFTLSMTATIAAPSITFVNVVTALSGVGFAAITSTPNMLVTLYNSDREVRLGHLAILKSHQFQFSLCFKPYYRGR